ncbi:conglutin alpha 2-like [Phoenix dactylifera]|uniref:Conglutin alpha 2-like n=1 Tax=Phoenix dactylifera TaxID=42345 RepID=A0A8B7CMK1_PHODC|nr:conglutin alpha 2-like [Phoenix dactylifera]XP_017700468.2 conglutin alpha 2-like [Phoenix dactylifera]XP_017700469.2 conglutin alpha 2-like [Phoenix dactylifera]XP_038975235.1 conglutin alpha 2-like [Phoenix dactylifera]XP_038975236.1 conglutin alpha 2-like [Phoenix dactylifera]
MKRKKWKEEEEATLIREYSGLLSVGVLAKLRTREKKFQPIADRVNTLHHHRDPVAFPFRWSWRDVSIKIQNMRHQYLNVKHKLLHLPPPSSSSSASASAAGFDWDQGVHLWPNFLLYKKVFGDLDLEPPKNSSAVSSDDDEEEDLEEPELGAEDEEKEDGEQIHNAGGQEDFKGFEDAGENPEQEDEEVGVGLGLGQERCRGGGGRLGVIGSRVAGLGEIAMRREERRREREAAREAEDLERRRRRRRAREQRREADAAEEEEEERRRERRWRRRMEERRDEEEMEWRERLLGMQMEHEKQVMQMHADACQSQMQMIGILIRLVCQFLGAGAGGSDGGLGGMPPPVMQQQQQQQQQQSPESLVGNNGKNGDHSGGHYL